VGSRAAEYDNIQQRVRSEPVGAVHRNAGRLSDRYQAGNYGFGVAVVHRHDFAMQIGGHAAHVVMDGRQHRDRLARHVDAGEYPRGLADPGQALVQQFGAEMLEVQQDVILFRPDATAFVDFDGHRAAGNVASGQILGARRIALHEPLAFGVGEITAPAARSFGDQAAGTGDAGGMKLREFHILKRQPGAQRHGVAVAGADMGGGAGEIDPAIFAGRQDRAMGAKAMQRVVFHVPGQHAATNAVLVHQKVEREVFDEELGVVTQALLVERMQDGVASAVGRGTGTLRHLLAVTDGLPTKGALIDQSVPGARERHAIMFELEHRGHRLAAHIFNRVLIAEPIGTLDGVVHMEAPLVAVAHVSERGRHAALHRHGVTSGREHFCNAGRLEARRRHSQCGPKASAAVANDDDVVTMVDDFVGLRHRFNSSGSA
jgi:hypothetical protein